MKNKKTNNATTLEAIPKAGIQNGINNHKKVNIHFRVSGKRHLEAVTYHGIGNHEKAEQCTVEAHEEDVKHYTVKF